MRKSFATLFAGITLGAGGVAAIPDKPTLQQIEQSQEQQKSKSGKYSYTDFGGRVDGQKLPDNMRVNEYETWDGQFGYEIRIEDAKREISIGYGPQAEERTWQRIKPIEVASGTVDRMTDPRPQSPSSFE